MAFSRACLDLRVHDCEGVAAGATAADIVEEVSRRLRKEKGIKLPATQVILEDGGIDDPMGTTMDPAAATIVRRLREALNLQGNTSTPDAGPAISRVTGR